ncbi:MAG: sulfatase-like hydrolase/transferase [Bacteroidota bacterium]
MSSDAPSFSPRMLPVAFGIFVCCFLSCRPTQSPQETLRPNILLIMADDLGYNDLSCYGSPHIQTPTLDRLATEGVRFTDYHANGAVCSPTRAALLSGLYQQRIGIDGVVYTWLRDSLGMAQEVHTIAESLKEGGYKTAVFGKWHLGYKTEFNPIHQGFDLFRGFVAGNVDYHSHLDNQLVFDWWRNDSLQDDPGYSTDLITQYALDFLASPTDTPFFLYLPYAAPHDPYQGRKDPPVRQAGMPPRKVSPDSITYIYKEMVEVLDEGIGKIIDLLAQKGIVDNTFIFFCSDNGANRHGSNHPLRGFKGGLYEGGHRVPAIAYWPGKIPKGLEIETPIMSMDLYPTLTALSQIPMSSELKDGVSFLPLLTDGTPLTERPLFWSYNKQLAMRMGDWKLVQTPEGSALYNLRTDISEQKDLSDAYPDRFQLMQEEVQAWYEEIYSGQMD